MGVVQATTARVVAADRRKRAGFGKGEGDQLLHDPQDKVGSGGNFEFLKQAVQMGVYRVFRNVKATGDTGFREIVKNTLDNLQLAPGDAQGAGDFSPGMIVEQ